MQFKDRYSSQRGFTLVELLVVIAIIGVLVGLLLPAVQAAREAARRSTCSNNFKQSALGLLNYESTNKKFPRGQLFWASAVPAECGPPPSDGLATLAFSWPVHILPYIEQGAVYDQFDFSQKQILGSKNFRIPAQKIPTYMCPSDPQAGELCDFTSSRKNGASPLEDFSMTNIVGVADSEQWLCDPTNVHPKQLQFTDGMFGEREGLQARMVTDGLSQTLMLAELTGGGEGTHKGSWWAVMAMTDTRDGINGPFTVPGGGVYSLSGQPVQDGWRATGPSSYHPGGCFFAMGDGSVHFVSENISALVLKAQTTRAGGEAFGDD